MKLKLGLIAGGAAHDITLSGDVTTTVGEAARALVRSGLFAGSDLEELVALRRGHVTLLGSPGEGTERLLDPAAPLGASGLQSGWQITVVSELGCRAPRVIPSVGTVEVLSGSQEGAAFSLVPGANTLGRDPQSRILLDDRGVSRRHAVIEAGRAIALRDLGSVNGIEAFGQRYERLTVDRPIDVALGAIDLRITPGAPASPPSPEQLDHRSAHTRAPRVDPRFPASRRELPHPPQPAQPSRIPVLAMLAPMMIGGAVYAVTGSAMSLMMAAFTPLMMIGSWIDSRASGARRLRRETREFEETLAREREGLTELRRREIAMRGAENPELAELADAMRNRGRLLWARRPEHRSFLELRFGEGLLPSRTEVALPRRGEAAGAHWDALRALQEEFASVAPVPVLERLGSCGSVGIAGGSALAAGLARSIVLQLAGLHSPAELVLAAFAGTTREGREWEWLKWLPHVDPVASPLAAWQLADDAGSATRLLISLEGLLEQRSGRLGGAPRAARSHIAPDGAGAESDGRADRAPIVPSVAVLVLESEVAEAHRSRLIALAEHGPDFGIHVIWVAAEVARVPAACRTFVEVAPDPAPSAGEGVPGRVGFVRRALTVPLSRVESVGATEAALLARSLAPVDDTAARALDESDLPRSVQLRELHETDLLGGAAPILQSWRASGSIVSTWRRGEEREPIRLSATVGQGAEAPIDLDLRAHGPHALVGGTTGAGKSEFLQSWIMSLAASLSPDRLTFLLVDYKGGAAFAECVDLPHTVGLVTDLAPHLVRRALASLRAELRHREELLAEHGAKDLLAMERRSDPAAPPALVIVIDEFAALATEVPEFVDGVVDIAQRGRSLGLHLIMATQRPAGVITDNLRANTNLRVALRMADEGDSIDVVGVRDAAFFDAATPGRGAVKIGPGRILHFQSGYLGGRAGRGRPEARLEIRTLGFVEGEPWSLPGEASRAPRSRDAARQPRDIERLRDALIVAAERGGIARPRRPWLDVLPQLLTLDAVRGERDGPGAAIGLRDRPEAQTQEVVTIDFEEVGNLAVFGASGSGKTTALLTLAASLSTDAATDPVQVYAIDAGGSLDPLAALPTVGAVASLSDVELVQRVLHRIREIVAERGPRFAAARANGLEAYRRTPASAREPRVLLLLDGFAAFDQACDALGSPDSPMQVLGGIMQAGRAVGVHVALTADRAGALPSTLAASVLRRLVLRLAAEHDYALLDVPADVLRGAPPGRGVFAGQTDEVQLATLGVAPDLAAQAAALESLGAELRGRSLVPVPEVRNAPERVRLDELAVETEGRPAYGIETRSFIPLGMPVSGLGVIAGPAGSGLSTAALSCATALARWCGDRGEGVERVLLSFDTGARGLGGRADWDRVACGVDAVAALARELTAALGGRPATRPMPLAGGLIGDPVAANAGDADAADPLAPPFPAPGSRGVIVVERPADAEESDALPQLVALARAARRADALVLFEFEQGSGGAVWDLFTVLKQPRWGLMLQPDGAEGQSPFREQPGRVHRADFPPGRGLAVESGRLTPVQVALPSPEDQGPVRYPG